MVICYIGMGSNLGDRRGNLDSAVRKIVQLEKTRVLKVSRVIETDPVGGPKCQGKFLNACLQIETGLRPMVLFKRLKRIEKDLGRRRAVRNGPRTIDLDILFYGDKIINSRKLQIPHPRMFTRDFVLEPLLRII